MDGEQRPARLDGGAQRREPDTFWACSTSARSAAPLRRWLATVGALATGRASAIRAAQDFERGWRPGRPSSSRSSSSAPGSAGFQTVDEIGKSIASELRQLIDYHNAGSMNSMARTSSRLRCWDRSANTSTRHPAQAPAEARRGAHGLGRRARIARVAAPTPRRSPRRLRRPRDGRLDLDESMLLAMVFDDKGR